MHFSWVVFYLLLLGCICKRKEANKVSFKKYKGNDKYHFRFYKKSIFHPFIVVAVTEETIKNGKILISGYMMTTSLERVINKPGCYKRLKTNPNPNDDKPSFVNKYRVNEIPASCFTKPHSSWHLSKDDELLIDRLEEKNAKKKE